MATRQLDGPPRILPLYARALAPLLPGASRLPWVSGRDGSVPVLELTLSGVRVDLRRLADYDRTCSFPVHEALPATYPHVLAFPLQLALITDRHFPFAAVGLVHVANRITQHRPLDDNERLELRVHATPVQRHPRGRIFSLVTEAWVAGELIWEELSTMLHREHSSRPAAAQDEQPQTPPPLRGAEWRLPGELGRRYATVSGDRNPIHLHALAAKAFGFQGAIAHGMWTKARCLAALQHRLPGAFTVEVRFRRPILLPATVVFSKAVEVDGIRFWVHDPRSRSQHLDGWVQPAAAAAHGGGEGP
jgi:acyl dehydratase